MPRVLDVEVVLIPTCVHGVDGSRRLECGEVGLRYVASCDGTDAAEQIVRRVVETGLIGGVDAASGSSAAATRGVVLSGVEGIAPDAEVDLRDSVQ